MMFKEKPINKLYAFALAAVFALTLAGCGGGGTAAIPDPEPPVVEPEPDPGPTPEEIEAKALKDAQDAAMAAYMAAMAAVGGAKDPVAMGNAQTYADMAKGASDAAAMATTSAMAMGHQTAAESARDKAMEAAGVRGLGITKLANKITNQSAIDNAVLEGKTGDAVPKPASNAGRVGTAMMTAGTAEAAATAVAADTPGGSISQGGAVSATATYGASGPTITVAADAVTGFDAVTRGESPVSLMTRGGSMGAELVGGSSGATNSMTYANVYTDIQAPEIRDTYAAADATNTISATDLAADLTDKPEITGDVPSDGSDFSAMYNEDPEDNAPPVTGLFDCPDDTACSISVKDGVITAIQGYIFRPRTGVGDRRVTDADYLAWGVWLIVPNATAATDTATAGAFASGNDVFTVNATLKGTATYMGAATGLYSAGGMVEYFDADASLTADFGGTGAADSTPGSAAAATDNDTLLLGAVTGMISNIKAGGMDVEGSISLKKANVLTSTAGEATTNGFMGDTSGTLAGRSVSGEWGGQFYGPNKATGKGIETEFPTTAAGTFGAQAPGVGTDQIRILGSFGTSRQ